LTSRERISKVWRRYKAREQVARSAKDRRIVLCNRENLATSLAHCHQSNDCLFDTGYQVQESFLFVLIEAPAIDYPVTPHSHFLGLEFNAKCASKLVSFPRLVMHNAQAAHSIDEGNNAIITTLNSNDILWGEELPMHITKEMSSFAALVKHGEKSIHQLDDTHKSKRLRDKYSTKLQKARADS
jgi:hypothetical protein